MGSEPSWGRGEWSRRRFLQGAAAVTGASVVGFRIPAWATGNGGYLSTGELATLNAALARMIPASGPGDWSAADLGVAAYIDQLLAASFGADAAPPIFAGGPYREASQEGGGFGSFQRLSRVKTIGWQGQVTQWRQLYKSGIAGLDRAAGGNYAAASEPVQDAILAELDTSGDDFFAVLFDHTMEGAYGHPVYGGNVGYRAWQSVGFAGDVHGVRFPGPQYSHGAWNIYGGYAPEEILGVGSALTEQPVVSPVGGQA